MSKFSQAWDLVQQDSIEPTQEPTPALIPLEAPPAAVVEHAPTLADDDPPPVLNTALNIDLNTDQPRSTLPPQPDPFEAPPPPMHPSVGLSAEYGQQVEHHLVSLRDPTTFEAEQYRVLSHLIEKRHADTDFSVIGISSPAKGDGKTTTAINVASTLAQTYDARVLLIDADLRQPSIPGRLGLHLDTSLGLVDAVQDTRVSLADAVQACPHLPFAVLLTGRMMDAPHNVLHSPQLGDLFAAARQSYDYVIVDTPPLTLFPDCRLIEKWADGFMVVVTAHRTPRKLVEEAISVLDPQKLIGLIFNRDNRQAVRYYGRYGYGTSTVQSWLERLGKAFSNLTISSQTSS